MSASQRTILVLFFYCSLALADPSTWARTYSYGAIRHLVAQDNGHIVFASEDSSINIVDVDQSGDPVWESSLSGTLYGFTSISSGGFMVLHSIDGQLTITGLDSAGDSIWSTPAPISTDIKKLIDTGDNCCVYSSHDSLVKLNSDGSVKWISSISSSMDSLLAINNAIGEPAGISLAGISDDNLLQLGIADSSGIVLWTGLGYHQINAAALVHTVFGISNGFCCGLATFETVLPPYTSSHDLVCINPNGTKEWSKKASRVVVLCESQDGNLVAFGVKNMFGGDGDDIFIRLMSAETGSYYWTKTHGFPEVDDDCFAATLCPDGGYAAGGLSGSSSLLLRMDSNGTINGMGINQDEPVSLASPIPNPASSSLAIPFSINSPGMVLVQIFDLTGRSITTPADEYFSAGQHSATWNLTAANGDAVPNGLYCVVLSTDETVITEKTMVLR